MFWIFAVYCLFILSPLAIIGVPLSIVANVLDVRSGINHIEQLINFDSTIKQVDEETLKQCNQFKLPIDLVDYVRKNGNSAVGTLPNCIGYCISSNLNWDPLPVIQLDRVILPYVDKLCADHYAGGNAPKFIIWASTRDLMYDFGEINHRNPILEAPLTALAIWRNYEVVKTYKNSDVVLLQHRSNKMQMSLINLQEQEILVR